MLWSGQSEVDGDCDMANETLSCFRLPHVHPKEHPEIKIPDSPLPLSKAIKLSFLYTLQHRLASNMASTEFSHSMHTMCRYYDDCCCCRFAVDIGNFLPCSALFLHKNTIFDMSE